MVPKSSLQNIVKELQLLYPPTLYPPFIGETFCNFMVYPSMVS